MTTYQTGALTEADCELIASALQHYQPGALPLDELERLETLQTQFADPATHLIQLDD